MSSEDIRRRKGNIYKEFCKGKTIYELAKDYGESYGYIRAAVKERHPFYGYLRQIMLSNDVSKHTAGIVITFCIDNRVLDGRDLCNVYERLITGKDVRLKRIVGKATITAIGQTVATLKNKALLARAEMKMEERSRFEMREVISKYDKTGGKITDMLLRAGINSVDDICKAGVKGLKNVRGIGPASIEAIAKSLHEEGINLTWYGEELKKSFISTKVD